MYTVKKSGISQFTVKFGANTLAANNDSRQYSLYMKNFNIPNAAVLLPVKLESFTAQLNNAGNRVDLQWVTASEMNVSHFAIEKAQMVPTSQTQGWYSLTEIPQTVKHTSMPIMLPAALLKSFTRC